MIRRLALTVGLVVLTGFSAWAQTEITWMNYAQPQEKAVFEKLVAKFEASHPGVTVKMITTTGDQFGAKIQAAMASNTMPDVFYVGPADVRTYVDNHKLLDLTPYVAASKDIDTKQIWENALKKYRYDGKVIGQGAQWALPKDLGPFAFGYNKTMFKKAGIPLPSKDKPYTWAEWIDVCKKLTKDTNGSGKNNQWGTGLNVRWSFIQFAWGNGADFLDPTQTKVTITDPKFTEALQFFADQTLKYGITPSMGEAQSMDTYQRWLKGQIAFFPIAPWDLGAFKDLPFDYDLIPWPVSKDGMKSATWVGSLGYGVAANTKNPELAAQLAIWLSGDYDAQKTMVDLDLQVPNISSLKEAYIGKPGKPANREEYIKIISDYGRSWPADNTYNSVWFDEFWPNIQRVLDGKMSAVDYCKMEEPKMQKLLDKANAKMKK